MTPIFVQLAGLVVDLNKVTAIGLKANRQKLHALQFAGGGEAMVSRADVERLLDVIASLHGQHLMAIRADGKGK